jgi:predicted glycoside hydrolase/deacetylase ChbG (UPF0249 family)
MSAQGVWCPLCAIEDGRTGRLVPVVRDRRWTHRAFGARCARWRILTRYYLTINADDFGFARDVNAGIVEAHRDGVLTSTTLMANGDAFEDAVNRARETPTLDIGCHLVLVQGRSALTGGPLPASLSQLVPMVIMGKLDAYAEFAAQINKIVGAGIRPSHLDTHKHTHLLPKVFRAVVRLAKEYAIPYVRLPVDTTLPMSATIRRHYDRMLSPGVVTTDHFIGFRLTGSLTEETLAEALLQLPEGRTEFMCHPGRMGNELARAQTRLKESRVKELEALISPRIREAITTRQIQLVPFSTEEIRI